MAEFNLSTKQEFEGFISNFKEKISSKKEEYDHSSITFISDESKGSFPDNVVAKIMSSDQGPDDNGNPQDPILQYLIREETSVDPKNPWPGSNTYQRTRR